MKTWSIRQNKTNAFHCSSLKEWGRVNENNWRLNFKSILDICHWKAMLLRFKGQRRTSTNISDSFWSSSGTFFENDFPAGTKYAGWKVPADTSTMTTRRLMASPCLNNSDSSRRKSLAKVLEDGADFWRLWIALGGLVICKYLIISYLTEFDIKCMAVNLPGHSCRLEWNGIKSLTKQLVSLAYSWEIRKEHRFYHRNQVKGPFYCESISFFSNLKNFWMATILNSPFSVLMVTDEK